MRPYSLRQGIFATKQLSFARVRPLPKPGDQPIIFLTRIRVLRAIQFRTRCRMAGANCKVFANSRHRSYSRTMKWMQLWILTALWLGAGGGNVLGAAQAKISILTSFPPVYCFTANVAGD